MTGRLTLKTPRVAIAATFVVGLVATTGFAASCLIAESIYPDDFTEIVGSTLVVYSMHLAAVIGGLFSRAKHPRFVDGHRAWLALTFVALWNLLIVGRFGYFALASADSVDGLLAYVERVSGVSSFLVVGVLTYFFASET